MAEQKQQRNTTASELNGVDRTAAPKVSGLMTNRTGLLQTLLRILDSSAAGGSSIALICIDIDDFREVNLSCGFDVGDAVLNQIGRRLDGALRQSDFLFRIGDDEFGIVLPSILHQDHAVLAAHKIISALEEPFVVPGIEPLELRASMGIALHPDTASDAEEMLRQATMAMYRAKSAQSGYAVYQKVATPVGISPMQFTRDLRHAVVNNDLVLYFQPKHDLQTKNLVGVEALCRWQHSGHGLITPDEFIPIAEESGIITSISSWVLNSALRKCAEWDKDGISIDMSVNLSIHDLREMDFPDLVQRMLKTWRVDPHMLILEITETAMMEDQRHTLGVLRRLSELGVRLSIDDFGSGYSSLNYLQQMPVNELKIEKEFVIKMERSESDTALVRTVIDLGHNYSLTVAAEGVETANSLHILTDLGCDLGQGIFFSPPLPAEELEKNFG